MIWRIRHVDGDDRWRMDVDGQKGPDGQNRMDGCWWTLDRTMTNNSERWEQNRNKLQMVITMNDGRRLRWTTDDDYNKWQTVSATNNGRRLQWTTYDNYDKQQFATVTNDGWRIWRTTIVMKHGRWLQWSTDGDRANESAIKQSTFVSFAEMVCRREKLIFFSSISCFF
jgi:hypothetical protein